MGLVDRFGAPRGATEAAALRGRYTDDRLADTMGWDVPAVEPGYYLSAAKMLLKRGYR